MEVGRSMDTEGEQWTNREESSHVCSVLDVSQDFVAAGVAATSVEGGSLTSLPKSFAENLSGLTKIDVSNKGLTKLEFSFEESRNLEELLVDGNRLERLPTSLRALTSLKLLSAAGNRLTVLPEGFEELTGVEVLRLASNKLSTLPDSCIKYGRLRILDLSRNALQAPPRCVSQGSPLLEVLDLSYNRISDLGLPPCSERLRKLLLGHNPTNDKFPGWLLTNKCSRLEELVLDETRFSTFDIPAGGPVLPHLKRLSMVKCGLSDVVFDQMSRSMVDLEVLSVGNGLLNRDGNIFWAMPARGFASPDKVKEIYIQAAGLPALPQEVNRLRNLVKLDVSRNSISSMPEEICELARLKFLNAAHNSLYALPQAIGKLTALKIFFLESNKLSSLPDSTQCLVSLELMDLYNNEFLQLPTQLKRLPKLRALDMEGNVFTTENLQIENMSYLEARNVLRSTSGVLLLRSNDPKVFSDSDDNRSYSSIELGDYSIPDEKLSKDTNLNDIGIQENWDLSEDSADEYDPTVQPRIYHAFSSPTVSSSYSYGKFCPADLHCARIKDQLAAMRRNGYQNGPDVELGQFDDA